MIVIPEIQRTLKRYRFREDFSGVDGAIDLIKPCGIMPKSAETSIDFKKCI